MTALALGLPPVVEWAVPFFGLTTVPSFLYESTWLLAMVTSVIVLYVYRAAGDYFVRFYLLSLAVKLLACAGYCLWMIRDDPSGAMANVIYFLTIYLLFTTLEIAFLYREITRRTRP